MEIDFSSYTYNELLDVVEHIDKDAYPERYSTVINLIKARDSNHEKKTMPLAFYDSKCFTKKGEIEQLAIVLTPHLIHEYKFQEFYNFKQVKLIIAKATAETSPQLHYAYAMFCSPDDFYQYYDKQTFDYQSLRLEVSSLFFGEPMLFTVRLLVRFANGENMKGSYRLHKYSHNGPSGGGGASMIN
ncbi:hypothetical protein H4J56_19220 [Colwellia sp. BRX8-4]|uniref:DUF6559 family protein n=1 Tax=Colwellia sp. BRX8-4 TaxID=2759836 RepID=UPI0015F5069B|nr:DUF6559 family protein [Colwellia sp. BRX8-4]MBA6364889.1 hypothetical protein [Colwellia sp. BRX8-8]MBA6373545.1 hypothetical protein [Colwellia sp. BRX8-4]